MAGVDKGMIGANVVGVALSALFIYLMLPSMLLEIDPDMAPIWTPAWNPVSSPEQVFGFLSLFVFLVISFIVISGFVASFKKGGFASSPLFWCFVLSVIGSLISAFVAYAVFGVTFDAFKSAGLPAFASLISGVGFGLLALKFLHPRRY